MKLFLLCYIVFIAFYSSAQKIEYRFTTGASLLMVSSGDAHFKHAGFELYNGVLTVNPITPNVSFTTGALHQYTSIQSYKNTVPFITNWVNGPETTEVNLSTDIKQQLIAFPFLAHYNFHNIAVGGGASLHYLLSANTTQHIEGEYEVDGYAGGNKDDFTARVKRIHELKNHTEISPFNTFNINGILSLEYQISPRFSIHYQYAYAFIRNNRFNHKFHSYRLQSNQLSLHIHLNKNNHQQ
jgi:hypothetical protein